MTAMTGTLSSAPVDVGWRPADRLPAAEAALIVGSRILLWVGVQLLVAGLILVGGLAGGLAINAAAGWWMVYGAIVDLGTLVVLVWLLRRHRIGYRELLGPATRPWQIAIGAVGVLLATAPAIFFSAELTAFLYGPDAIPPMLAVVDVPPPAAAFSVVVWPLLAELVEPVAYLGLVLPALERLTGRAWLAGTITVAVWAGEHAFFPILLTGGGLDLTFAAYRVVSVVPFLAIWTGLYYAYGRRLLPIMLARWVFNGGTAIALALGLF